MRSTCILLTVLAPVSGCTQNGVARSTTDMARQCPQPLRQGAREKRVLISLGDAVTPRTPVSDRGGRILLLFAGAEGNNAGADPLDAPFWEDPQPIYSIAVRDMKAGMTAAIDDGASVSHFPADLPISKLTGQYEIQAVLDADSTTSGFSGSASNFVSAKRMVNFTSDDDTPEIALTIDRPMPVQPPPADTDRVRTIRVRSTLLTAFANGRDRYLTGAVILPSDYDDRAKASKHYAVVYDIPGFGGRYTQAWAVDPESATLHDRVIRVMLDPDGPYGHHLFVNSDNNGPMGDALVKEFIPALQAKYRTVNQAEGRLLTGHSSGGFASANLQICYPEFFCGCWATSPDPVDFRAFQNFDIYSDESAYVDNHGRPRPSVRIGGKVACTVAQENGMENALDPTGMSGQQWDSWIACFSGHDPVTNRPIELWDQVTGKINHTVAQEYFSRHDPSRIVIREWPGRGSLLARRLRIIVGDADNFDLNRGVSDLRDELDRLPGWKGDPPKSAEEGASRGYIEIVSGATHFDLDQHGVGKQVRDEMIEYLQLHGYSR